MSYSRVQWKSIKSSKYDFNALIYACIFSVLQSKNHEVSWEQLTHTKKAGLFYGGDTQPAKRRVIAESLCAVESISDCAVLSMHRLPVESLR